MDSVELVMANLTTRVQFSFHFPNSANFSHETTIILVKATIFYFMGYFISRKKPKAMHIKQNYKPFHSCHSILIPIQTSHDSFFYSKLSRTRIGHGRIKRRIGKSEMNPEATLFTSNEIQTNTSTNSQGQLARQQAVSR